MKLNLHEIDDIRTAEKFGRNALGKTATRNIVEIIARAILFTSLKNL